MAIYKGGNQVKTGALTELKPNWGIKKGFNFRKNTFGFRHFSGLSFGFLLDFLHLLLKPF